MMTLFTRTAARSAMTIFEVTPERQLNADLQVVPAQLALCGKLRRQLIETADRSLHHLREERYEQTVSAADCARRIFAAVHVNNVAHGLENENDRPSGRQNPIGECGIAERGRQQLEREIPVFHRVEQVKTADRANYRDLLLLCCIWAFCALSAGLMAL